MEDDVAYRNVRLLQLVRVAICNGETLRRNLEEITYLLPGSGWATKYAGLDDLEKFLRSHFVVAPQKTSIFKEDIGPLSSDDLMFALSDELQGLLSDLEREALDARIIRCEEKGR